MDAQRQTEVYNVVLDAYHELGEAELVFLGCLEKLRNIAVSLSKQADTQELAKLLKRITDNFIDDHVRIRSRFYVSLADTLIDNLPEGYKNSLIIGDEDDD